MVYDPRPLLFNDKSGNLLSGHYREENGRMDFRYKHAMLNDMLTIHIQFADHEEPNENFHVVLNFGPQHALGTITFHPHEPRPMEDFLPQFTNNGSSRDRKFKASNQQEYRIQWALKPGEVWTCTNANGHYVASYDEPNSEWSPPRGYSGYVLAIDPDYANAALEIFASAMILRHVVAYGL